MMLTNHPTLDDLIRSIGAAGLRLAEIHASEAAAGNISVFVGWELEPQTRFSCCEEIPLPLTVPELAGKAFLVSGSGRRLRQILADPGGNLGLLVVGAQGRDGSLFTAPERRFTRLTSEFNSHLAVHYEQVLRRGLDFHALVHAQPLHLTYLSHVPQYQEEIEINRRLLRWQPETIINLPEGIGVLPFCLPGSPELMAANVEALKNHRLAVWCKHGVMARSDKSVLGATDLIEYTEAAARYEFLNLQSKEPSTGLTPAELRAICAAFGVEQQIF